MPITACLWFDGQAREAAEFYVSVLRDGRIGASADYNEASSKAASQPAGSTMIVPFEAEGQRFLALNGGPMFTFSEAISFVVERDTQAEIDELWDALTADGGEPSRCGWLKDRFGVSWQVVPRQLPDLMRGGGETTERVTAALMGMGKIDIEQLERARDGEGAAV
jgi:predicted 3-demethylubiquinone-9 3-methyltransferase (glyoxalase superfamily)